MEKEGRYIYCVIAASQERNFGPIGIGGRGDDVLTVDYNDLSMVVSSHPMTKFVVNRDNMLAHERVIEEVMREFNAVLPVRFGTIASNADEIRNLLDRRHAEFKNALRDVDHKVELGVKGVWKNMEIIFQEIVEEDEKIKRVKEEIVIMEARGDFHVSMAAKMEVGRMVEKALVEKKEIDAQRIVGALRRTSFDHKLNKTMGDEMFMNAAFLVDKGREKEFDNIMDDLSKKYKERMKFMYAGPLPVFNFVNIVVYPQKWEK